MAYNKGRAEKGSSNLFATLIGDRASFALLIALRPKVVAQHRTGHGHAKQDVPRDGRHKGVQNKINIK